MTEFPICNVNDCPSPARARGWCMKHYKRWSKHGDPLAVKHIYRDPEAAFEARTEWRGDCLVWTGSGIRAGYGTISVFGKAVRVHRYAWTRAHGSIPDSAQVDHICWNRRCVNVDHLRLATPGQNCSNLQGANRANKTTGRRNVQLVRGRYRVSVVKDGHRFGGYYSTLDEAVVAADLLRRSLFGEFSGRG